MAAKPGFISAPRIFVDRSFFYGFVDRRECFGQEFFCLFPVFIVDGSS
jgi:hypothetical protein